MSVTSHKFEANFLRKHEILLKKVNSFEDSKGTKNTLIAIATLILQCLLTIHDTEYCPGT